MMLPLPLPSSLQEADKVIGRVAPTKDMQVAAFKYKKGKACDGVFCTVHYDITSEVTL